MSSSALVSADWLYHRRHDPTIKTLDASWHMATPGKGREDFGKAHIQGARFFDIPEISDQDTSLPNMLPPIQQFEQQVGALGIGNLDHVIVYDTLGIFSAPRVWWMFRVFGHEKVSVLNGGLPAWQGKGYPTTSGDGGEILPVKFQARLRPDLVRNYGEIKSNCALAKEQLVDFRSSARFRGEVAEHFPGVKPGHIPGSKNLPYTELLAPNNEMKNKSDIKSEYQKIHVDLDKPITTTCGSGVTACIGALSLFELGIENVAVYDGSYTEWGQTV